MEKFDSKREKVPKVKDSINFKKFLSDKYLNKKYASIKLEKELSPVKIEKTPSQPALSEPNSSSDDSSTPGTQEIPGGNVITPNNDMIPGQLEEKEKQKFDLEVNQVSGSPLDNDIVTYPNIVNLSTTDIIESSSPDVDCQVFKENGQNDRNLFFFENFNTPCDNSVDIKDWGIIWESTIKPQIKKQDNENENEKSKAADILDNSDSQSKGNTFNLLDKEEGNKSNANNASDTCEIISIGIKKADWEFPVEFDLVSLKTNTTSTNISPDNITSLSQNLNGIYSNYSNSNTKNTNKKTFDDLERYLSDSAFMTPADKKPIAMPLPVNSLVPETSLNTNINGSVASSNVPTNSLFPNMDPQLMMNYSYKSAPTTNNSFQMQGYNNNSSNGNSTFNYRGNYGAMYGSNYGLTASGADDMSLNLNLLSLNPQSHFQQQAVTQVNYYIYLFRILAFKIRLNQIL
jgi:hypothetical protein